MWGFGDSFDLYATVNDSSAGYWDTGVFVNTAVGSPGRFGGQYLATNVNANPLILAKSSGQNDAVHHVNFAFRTLNALTGTSMGIAFGFYDGTNAQCTVQMRSDGALQLISGAVGGAVLATYAGAVPIANQWYAYEVEVVIHNTAGSFTVRAFGSSTNSFQATGLNTRAGSANNYANKMQIGNSTNGTNHQIDDVLWRSDPSSVPWVGDIRCYTRGASGDQQKQFTANGVATMQTTTNLSSGNGGANPNTVYWSPAPGFTCPLTGTVTAMSLNLAVAYTGHIIMALYAGGLNPGALLGTTSPVTNPGTGAINLTFPTPVNVTAGATYYAAILTDATLSNVKNNGTPGVQQFSIAQPYSSGFPNNPTGLTNNLNNSSFSSLQAILGGNCSLVYEIPHDSLTTYVSDSTVNDADFYGVAPISGTPPSLTVAVTTRQFAQKSDAGSRSSAVQLKSGGTTVNSGSVPLSTAFAWNWRTDLTDPNTSAAWTATAVNNAQIGPIVTA